jgi:predicted transcriptional regulator
MMTKRESLIERVATLPEELLDEVAQSVEDIVAWHQQGIYHLSDDERAAVRKGMEAARRGEFASDEEIAALYNRHRE